VIMDDFHLLMRFVVAAALGFVVGIQRESAAAPDRSSFLGGVRTFPLVSLLGCLFAYLGSQNQSVIALVAGFAVLGLLLGASQMMSAREGHPGMTTAIALLLSYGIGATCWQGNLILATALAVVLTLLLSMKVELHTFAHRLDQHDLVASLKFAMISAIILPLLPDHTYGPAAFQIFNPFKIWLMVVFISGIGFVGYLLVRLVGANRGIGLTGLLGGLASSTALTINFSQRSKEHPELSSSLATGIVIAWTVMYVRVLAIVWLISPELGMKLLGPMILPVLPGLAWCLWLWKRELHTTTQSNMKFNNPFELAPAIKFVGIILLVLMASKGARLEFGNSGLLLSSFIAGLADVDAIAVSVGQMVLSEDTGFLRIATISVVLAGIANTITKGCIAIFTGVPAMRRAIGPAMLLMISSGLLALWIFV